MVALCHVCYMYEWDFRVLVDFACHVICKTQAAVFYWDLTPRGAVEWF